VVEQPKKNAHRAARIKVIGLRSGFWSITAISSQVFDEKARRFLTSVFWREAKRMPVSPELRFFEEE
jgi:hypothetical protein